MTDSGSTQGQQQTQQQTRAHRTHLPCLLDILKSFSLADKLEKNKEIEKQNAAHLRKTFDNAIDPQTHTQPSSPAASLITLTSQDLEDLKNPNIFKRFKSLLLVDLLKSLTPTLLKKQDAEEPSDSEAFIQKR